VKLQTTFIFPFVYAAPNLCLLGGGIGVGVGIGKRGCGGKKLSANVRQRVRLQKESCFAGPEGKPTKNPRGGQARNLPAKGKHTATRAAWKKNQRSGCGVNHMSPAVQAVCLLRDFAARLAKDKGVHADGVRRQLRAINHAARQTQAIIRGNR